MTFFRSVFTAVLKWFRSSDVQLTATVETHWTGWRDQRVDDRKLTDNFTLYELTATSHANLQAENRVLNEVQIGKLTDLARLLERVRDILECPLVIHSGYRCTALNRAVGSRDDSQHLRSEAADFVPKGMDLLIAFSMIRNAAEARQIEFGQLIYEKAQRSYGTTEWIHISLGAPYRKAETCGEVLSMNAGKYELIEQVKVDA